MRRAYVYLVICISRNQLLFLKARSTYIKSKTDKQTRKKDTYKLEDFFPKFFRHLIWIGAEKITFLKKRFRLTDGHWEL